MAVSTSAVPQVVAGAGQRLTVPLKVVLQPQVGFGGGRGGGFGVRVGGFGVMIEWDFWGFWGQGWGFWGHDGLGWVEWGFWGVRMGRVGVFGVGLGIWDPILGWDRQHLGHFGLR